jgi:hypothetical protein
MPWSLSIARGITAFSEEETDMGQIADIIIGNARVGLWIAKSLLDGIEPDRFARLIDNNGQPVHANHPAFCYGHLSMDPTWAAMIGIGPIAAPPGFEELFKAGCDCRDDPDGTIYPPMEQIAGHFFSSYNAVLEGIVGMSDEQFAAQNPAEGQFREMCPTVGAATAFAFNDHLMYHLGQVSTWRRCMGRGSVM